MKSGIVTIARATAVSAVLLLVPASRIVHGADLPPHKLVTQANEALKRGEHDKALELYNQASTLLPNSPELAYNKAVAHYRKGEYAQAGELFAVARRTTDTRLDARARFNQGNCAYASALAKRNHVQEAIAELQSAITHYKDAIEADPTDRDARANIETAQLLMKDLLDKKNQQQKQENKDDQNQQQDQQEGDQKDKQKGEQQQEEQQQDGKNQQEREKQEQPGEQQQKEEQQHEQPQEQQQSQSADGAAPQEQDGKPAEQRQLSREEAQRLLQLIRDKELQRRQELSRRTRAKLVPVERDW